MKLNILNGRIERRESLIKELQSNGIDDYELWGDVHDRHSVVRTINKSFKQIIEFAQVAGYNEIAIAEDDIRFTNSNSWNYFLSQKPIDYDLFLGMVYLGQPDENNIVKSFTGMTIFICHSRFYDIFLSVSDNDHIDVLLNGLGKYVVCHPFIAYQANGFSSNTGKNEVYDQLLVGRALYSG